ncbi:MAG: hypothetical protein J5705_03265 [Bacteroidaceae bacterium]|nr:hypothetical protein [Bacteroidaceae bacterium]MBR5936033.1 hypothetical protein [Bacteroidaceae bacterium]
MKTKLVFLPMIIWLALCLTSCSDSSLFMTDYDEIATNDDVLNNQIDYNLIALDYLNLEDNYYFLDLTQKEAINLGIPKNEYKRMINEVKTANDFISSYNGDTKLILPNPRDYSTKDLIIARTRFLSRGEGNQERKRTINTQDNDWGHDSFWAPLDADSITCDCFSGGLLQVHRVQTQYSGLVYAGKGFAVLTGHTHFKVKLPATNVYVGVSFITSNASGGSCTYMW